MSTNFGASISSAVDDMHAEGEGTEEVVEEPKAPAKKPAAKKPAAKPAARKPVARKPAEPPAEEVPPAEPEEGDTEDAPEEVDAPPKANPWDKDLDERGINTPEVQQYMAEVIQPYITRLEQQGTPFQALFGGDIQAAQIGAGLLTELDENPAGAIAKIITAMEDGNPELLDQINQFLDESGGEETAAPEEPAPGAEGGENPLIQQLAQLPEFQFLREQYQNNQVQNVASQWDEYVTSIKEVVPDLDEDLFTLATAAAGDDQDLAFQYYNNYIAKRGAGAEPEPEAPAPPAPPVHGGAGGRPPAAPKKEYTGRTGLSDAIGDFLAEDKVARGKR